MVGASGAGKSTLADVLSGLLGPDQGTLEIGGVASGNGGSAQVRLSCRRPSISSNAAIACRQYWRCCWMLLTSGNSRAKIATSTRSSAMAMCRSCRPA
ncbi:ATP-binding cassette domain-containing protein [Pseudoxanthomonas kalamensis]|uniref:ATP-binding cassette domain-containing protein n=1 Tax=Pseudoxanthomonas kalamensis TaxID=289483 RepID=UPI001FE4ADB8|nr:ATP-binding cassette domain-containing protein [Pseudoxanthomonas kalamensis]